MLQWIKALFSPSEYYRSSIRLLDRGGQHGSTQPPFNYQRSVNEFRSWVYAAVWINASACAATPLRLYVRNRSRQKSLWNTRPVSPKRLDYLRGEMGGNLMPASTVMRKSMDIGDDMEEVTELHPVTELLQKTNHVYNGFDLTVLRTMYQELTGNAYLHPIIDQQLGVPTELWPMPPQWMKVIPSQENFIDGYSYGRTDVEALKFEVDEVIHFRRPNPDNLFYGLGKVEAAWGTVQANRAVHEMDLATFENHARPDYAVVVKGPHKRTDLDMFENHVSEKLRGTRKAGQFLAMSGDVQLTPLNFPPKDLGGREDIVEEIAAVFGVPVSMLKSNDPNLASARSGFAQWREATVLPILRMDEDVLNQVLLPMFGIEDDACLAYDNPVPADKEYELRERQFAVAGGWRTANEARLEEGKEPAEDELADALLINGQPLGASQMPLGGADPLGDLVPGAPPLPAQEIPASPDAATEEPVQQAEVEKELALNGAQIASLVELLQSVAAGTISIEAAVEVAVATGMGREQAAAMVESQRVNAKPVEAAPPVPEAEEVGEPISKAKADNCGTGAGGFKPGNDCAAGDGTATEDESRPTWDSDPYGTHMLYHDGDTYTIQLDPEGSGLYGVLLDDIPTLGEETYEFDTPQDASAWLQSQESDIPIIPVTSDPSFEQRLDRDTFRAVSEARDYGWDYYRDGGDNKAYDVDGNRVEFNDQRRRFSKNEQQAVGSYTVNASTIADEARAASSGGKPSDAVREIDKATSNVILKDGARVAVFRGCGKTEGPILLKKIREAGEHGTMTVKGFMSTTLDHRAAGKFRTSFRDEVGGEDTMLMLEIHAKNGAYIADQSFVPEEGEVLLPRNTEWRIKRHVMNSYDRDQHRIGSTNYHHVVLEEVQ